MPCLVGLPDCESSGMARPLPSPASVAASCRITQVGSPPQEIKAKKIIYSRKTNTFRIEDGQKIEMRGP